MTAQRIDPPADEPMAPAVEDWVLPVRDIEGWVRTSKPGHRLKYASGHQLVRGESSAYLRKLQDQQQVHLFQRRRDDGQGFDYLALRNQVKLVSEPPRRQSGPVLDAAMASLFLKLKAVAREGQRCPSDRALGAALGLTRNQVGWAMKKLVAVKLIDRRVTPCADDPKWRVVTIVATGLSTARPKGSAR